MSIQQIEVTIYRQGKRVAICPLQVQADPSQEQGILEYNQEDIAQAISAAIEVDRDNTTIAEITVQNPFTSEEVWEVLFTDGERANYVIEYGEEEDEDEMDDLAMLKDVLDEAGWHSKSHEINVLLKALIDGEHVCRLDSGSSGEDDLLIGTAHEVDVDVCARFEIEDLPEDWKITDVTSYIKSRMW